MTQFTYKGVKQINNRISFKYDIHLCHSYLSTFFFGAGVPNGEFPEILIAKCRSRFYYTWFFSRAEDFKSWRKGPSKSGETFFVGGGDRVGGKGVCGRLMSPVQRGRVNRYEISMENMWSINPDFRQMYTSRKLNMMQGYRQETEQKVPVAGAEICEPCSPSHYLSYNNVLFYFHEVWY